MIGKGKMTKVGLLKYEYGMKNNLIAPTAKEKIFIPKDFKNMLKNEIRAEENFNNLSKSLKMMYIHWINSAKKDETRKRRIKKAINLLIENKKSWEKYR